MLNLSFCGIRASKPGGFNAERPSCYEISGPCLGRILTLLDYISLVKDTLNLLDEV